MYDLNEAARRLEGEGATVEWKEDGLGEKWPRGSLDLGEAHVAIHVFLEHVFACVDGTAAAYPVASACAAAMLREVAMAKVAEPAAVSP